MKFISWRITEFCVLSFLRGSQQENKKKRKKEEDKQKKERNYPIDPFQGLLSSSSPSFSSSGQRAPIANIVN